MKSSHYTKQQNYRIYALIGDENRTYIGKTTCLRLSAIYSAHINGQYGATRGYYAKIGPSRPVMYLLEQQLMTRADAYKHVVAWVHVVINEGYWCINPDGTLEDAESLHPETYRVAEAIAQEPLIKILQRTRLEKPSAADINPKKEIPPHAVEALPCQTKLSIRLTTDDKALFCRFAAKLNMNQRQAFLYLLRRAEQSQNTPLEQQVLNSIHNMLAEHQKKLLSSQEHNQQLEQKLQELKVQKNKDKQLACENLRMAQLMICSYLQYCPPPIQPGIPLRELSYKRFKLRYPAAEEYAYPKAGQNLVQLEAIVWGQSRCPMYYLVGTSLDGQKYKFRVYSRDNYIGLWVRQSPYATIGSVWLLSGQLSKDGAVNLVASLPIVNANTAFLNAQKSSNDQKRSLSEMIQDAHARNIKSE